MNRHLRAYRRGTPPYGNLEEILSEDLNWCDVTEPRVTRDAWLFIAAGTLVSITASGVVMLLAR